MKYRCNYTNNNGKQHSPLPLGGWAGPGSGSGLRISAERGLDLFGGVDMPPSLAYRHFSRIAKRLPTPKMLEKKGFHFYRIFCILFSTPCPTVFLLFVNKKCKQGWLGGWEMGAGSTGGGGVGLRGGFETKTGSVWQRMR